MKVVYSHCTNGAGHRVQAGIIIDYLIKCGHDVRYVAEVPNLVTTIKDHELVEAHYEEFNNSGRVFNEISEFKPDIILNDFEPMMAGLGKVLEVPVISVGVQHGLRFNSVSQKVLSGTTYEKLLLNTSSNAVAYVTSVFYDLDLPVPDNVHTCQPFSNCYRLRDLAKTEDYNYGYGFVITPRYNEAINRARRVFCDGGQTITDALIVGCQEIIVNPIKNHTVKEAMAAVFASLPAYPIIDCPNNGLEMIDQLINQYAL